MTRLRAFRRDRGGVAAIEFGLLAVPFVVLVLGGAQLLIVSLTQQMLQSASEAISRQILTGTVQQAGLSQAQFVTLACSLLPATMNCNRLIIDVEVADSFANAVVAKPDLSSVGAATATTVLSYSPGTAGQIVVMRLLYALPVVTVPGFNLQSTASAYGFNFPMATSVFRNEAYGSASS